MRQLQAPPVRWKGAGGSVPAAAAPPLLEALSAWRSYRRAVQWSWLMNVSRTSQPSCRGWRWGLAASVGVPDDGGG